MSVSNATAPRFSIVTPTLNQGRFIEHTIKSLLNQTFDDFEHIVIDGGSSDDTHDILRRYEGRYRMRWVSGADDGMYDAVNKGLAMASGKIHAYLNSDDLYFPWTLATVAQELDRGGGADVIHGDAINVDDVTGAEHFRVFPAFDIDRLVSIWPLPQPAVFWRQEVTEALSGFDSGLKYVGDWDFFIRAGLQFQVLKLDEFLAVERRHMASKTLGETDPMAIETQRMLEGHGDSSLSSISRARMKYQALAARRTTWLRFVREARRNGRDASDPWSRFFAAGHVRIDPIRLTAGFVPGMPYRYKVDAITTGEDWLHPA